MRRDATTNTDFVSNRRREGVWLGALKAGLVVLVAFGLLTVCSFGFAGEQDSDSKQGENKRLLALPFPFYNHTIGAGLGGAVIAEGYVQPQMLTVGAGLFSAEGTYMVFALVRNYRVPWIKRLILDPQISSGEFENIKSYAINNPAFPDEKAGSNDSSKGNYVEADGSDFWFEFKMRYLLPVGEGADTIFPRTNVDNGVAVLEKYGGEHWNPLRSGRTYFELTPFYRDQDLSDDNGTVQKTAGIDLAVEYDNTDYRLNPSGGSYQRFFFSRDWGGFDSSAPWSVVGAEGAKYFPLGPSRTSRQRVVALNFWTVDCLTWNSSHQEDGQTVLHRPPTYKGANLGGLWRLKGYPASRFNDRSAIYYGMEYRHILKWNPLQDITLNGRMDVDWIQLTAFGELGRVAPSWTLDTLHEDMKWTLGTGVRAMVNHLVVRADLGFSSEDAIVQLFIGQPF
jgi:hypothetical protein